MTKKEKTEKCRYILYSYKGKVEFIDDIEFLYSIFECHDNWEQKKGCGVDYFYVGKTEFRNNYCFYIMRTDGTSTDISFTKSIVNPSKRSRVIDACRTAIQPEIDKLKEGIVFGKDKCPITGHILIPSNTHIDHYDLTFNELFNKWARGERDIDGLHDLVCEAKDNEFRAYFTSERLIEDFVNFHNMNTHLRAVTKEASLSILKRK